MSPREKAFQLPVGNWVPSLKEVVYIRPSVKPGGLVAIGVVVAIGGSYFLILTRVGYRTYKHVFELEDLRPRKSSSGGS